LRGFRLGTAIEKKEEKQDKNEHQNLLFPRWILSGQPTNIIEKPYRRRGFVTKQGHLGRPIPAGFLGNDDEYKSVSPNAALPR
jgi:hypothetical protein